MPPHTDTPDGDVHVFPRYLASTTGTGDPALAPLLQIGCNLHHDDLGNRCLTAPDHTVRLGYLPESEDDGMWRITAYEDPLPVITPLLARGWRIDHPPLGRLRRPVTGRTGHTPTPAPWTRKPS
ncbi:hypothetical protein [Streptomyces eurythermus]|uniref:hypothetical protein n=1 Tax=Streptomyces eurythermus TaxID=42237 RepID=UPI0036D3DF44